MGAFRIDSKNNPKIKYISRLLSDSGFRKKEGKLIIENPVMIDEALRCKIVPENIFISETAASCEKSTFEKYSALCKNIFIVSDGIFRKISDLETPQGVTATISAASMPKLEIKSGGKYVLLERVTDPGNIGTVIRTADAFAFDGVIMTDGCADVYSPKVMRSTMGGIFRIPVKIGAHTESVAAELKNKNVPIIASVLDKNAAELKTAGKMHSFVIMIGNEAAGLTETAVGLSDKTVYIGMQGEAESLNAAIAASIIMYTLS